MHSDHQTRVAAGTGFQRFALAIKLNEISGVDGPIARRYLDGFEFVTFRIEVRFQLHFGVSTLLREWIYLSVGSLAVLLSTGIRRALQQERVRSNGRPCVHICKLTFRARRHGFFGLAIGYLIWGGQALFGFPKSSPEVNRTLGLWALRMPGFMQFLTGIYLLTGLTWLNVFGKAAPLYMAGLAFTAYGIHWFAISYRRYIDSSAQPDGWMAIAFLFLSVLGADVFRGAGDIPGILIVVGLTLIYAVEIPPAYYRGILVAARRAVSTPYCYLADLLHVRHDSTFGIWRQSLGLKVLSLYDTLAMDEMRTDRMCGCS